MSKTTKKTVFILMIIILISKITGFLRDISLAQSFGAGNITDAYLTALNIPVVLFDGISAALGTTFIPMFFKIRENKGEEEVNKFTSNVLNIIILISGVFIFFGIIFAPYIVKIFAIGFDGDKFNLTVNFTRILMFSMVFIAANGLISSFLIANGNVYISGLITIPFNIFIIGAIVVGSFINPYIMVFGTLVAYVAQLVFVLPFLRKKQYKHSLKINIKDENIIRLLYLIVPVFLGSYVNQINTVVNTTLASTLDKGSITALNYANKLNMFAVGVIVISITTIMYPILSRLASENNIKAFKQNIAKSINIILIIMVPIMILTMDFSTPIVRILFEEGSFDSRATDLTSQALFYYSVGMVAYGLRDILTKGFYSLQDTKTPVKNGTIAVFINVFFSVVLVKYMGIGGLSLASSMSAIIAVLLLIVDLRKKIGKLGFKNISSVFIKVSIGSLVMGFVTRFLYNEILTLGVTFTDEGRKLMALGIIVSSCVGLVLYIILMMVFKVKEVKEIVNILKLKILNLKKIN